MNLFETSRQVTVLGAGMVGVSCALALQAKGWRVTLVDQQAPGEETSHGNAGVLSRSSFLSIQSTWSIAKSALDVAQIWAAIEDQNQCSDSVAVALAISLAR
jgi:glycine/D-amino acid oxidase-like deaminating enzyme